MNTLVEDKFAKLVAKELLKIKAVSINTKKPYRYVSGILAPLYTDNRLLISHPKAWKIIIDSYSKAIRKLKKKEKIEVLSGTATAAIPHAAVLGYELKIPMVYVRASKKEHGKGNLIEGELKKGARVLVIEDLISTGSSVKQNVEAIREAGAVVKACLAITTSTLSAYKPIFALLKIKLLTLTNIQTVIEVAKSEKYISAKEFEIVSSFLNDPKGWGKKMGFE